MNYSYYIFEKELTSGNHVSYHFVYDYFRPLSPVNSKVYPYEKFLFENVSSKIDLNGFQNALTVPNTTSDGAYLHIGMHKKSIGSEVKDLFHIKVDFPIIYFTKPLDDLFKKSRHKCGYYSTQLKNLNHKFEDQSLELMNEFRDETQYFILASYFGENGEVLHDEMNVEILPKYSKNNYYQLKDKLLKRYNLKKDIFDLYDKKFETYERSDFHYHVKIKLNDSKTTVKFYRTYPHNPYI
jgi:hypothetical protein